MAVKATNQVDIVDLTDGFSVVMSSEAVSLVGGTTYANAATATTTIYAYCGSEQVACSVDTTKVTFSGSHNDGITVSKDSSATQPTLTFTVAANTVNGNCEATIPVVITDAGVTLNKKFSFSVSKSGTNGTSVTVSSIKYAVSTTESQPADSSFTYTRVPSVAEGSWLWTLVTFSDSSKAYSKSKQGKGGTNGTSYYTHIRYSANSDGSGMVATPTASTIYIGVYSGTSSSAQTTASSYTWSKYKGDKGDAGDDAVTLTIESSAGFIFKNTQAVTTLTARVFKGATELTSSQIAALGTVKWYKDGGSTAVGTGLTLSITAGTVTNHASYTANLEA